MRTGRFRFEIVNAKTRVDISIARLSHTSHVDNRSRRGCTFVVWVVPINAGKMRVPCEAMLRADVLKIPRCTHPIGDVAPLMRMHRRGMDENEILPVNDEWQRGEILPVRLV